MVEKRATIEIAQIVTEHHQAVYGYAFRLTGSVADAEDLTQHVFLVAHQKIEQLQSIESARGWLFAILRNAFLKGHRKKRPVLAANLDLNIESVPEKLPADDTIDQEALQSALDELPEKFRIVLILFYFQDCSYRDISDQLGVPMGTVMSRLARAKRYLRSRLFPLSRPNVQPRQENPANAEG
jgi:RNA polymerase sigma-70 factor (ECF subfamily)